MAHMAHLHLQRSDVVGRLGQDRQEWELPVPGHQPAQLLPFLTGRRWAEGWRAVGRRSPLTIHGRWRGDSVREEQVSRHEGKVENMRSSRWWQPPALVAGGAGPALARRREKSGDRDGIDWGRGWGFFFIDILGSVGGSVSRSSPPFNGFPAPRRALARPDFDELDRSEPRAGSARLDSTPSREYILSPLTDL
jgi:hypothetical protein